MPKNMNMMIGTKPSTPPMPSTTPEMSMDLNGPSASRASIPRESELNRKDSPSTSTVL